MSPSFFFNDTATTEIYTLSLHDALPICRARATSKCRVGVTSRPSSVFGGRIRRSEEHTSELQSRRDLVCRLLLEKKKLDGRHVALHLASPPLAMSIRVQGEALRVGPVDG